MCHTIRNSLCRQFSESEFTSMMALKNKYYIFAHNTVYLIKDKENRPYHNINIVACLSLRRFGDGGQAGRDGNVTKLPEESLH